MKQSFILSVLLVVAIIASVSFFQFRQKPGTGSAQVGRSVEERTPASVTTN